MHGYAGKIGFIDLSRNRVTLEGLTEGLIKNYLGGISFLTRLLYDTVPAGQILTARRTPSSFRSAR